MKNLLYPSFCLSVLFFFSCIETDSEKNKLKQPIYKDVPYLQDYAVKYFIGNENIVMKKVYTDRNGVIQVLASNGLYRPNNGHFQYPGTLQPDKTYRPMAHKKISDMVIYQNQFVYIDDKAILSNAWAGKLYSNHHMPEAKLVCGGFDFLFMI